jgi:hypothetical protein
MDSQGTGFHFREVGEEHIGEVDEESANRLLGHVVKPVEMG